MDNELIQQIEAARSLAGDDARPGVVMKAHEDGSLTARERVTLLADAGSFVEYGVLAGASTQPDDENFADGLVAGVGLVGGSPVVIASYDSSVLDGTQSDRSQRKMAKLMYLAVEHRWPFVCFLNGAGARAADPLPGPPIAVAPRGRYDLYDGLAELNGWAPTIAVATGISLDGHVGIAMLSDVVIATQDAQFGSVDGPTRSVVDYAKTGNVDVLAENDQQAISTAREYLGFYLTQSASGTAHSEAGNIADIIPENRRRPYDMRKVIAAFADAGSVVELGKDWGRSMLTQFARLNGRTVGIYANQPKSPLAGAIDAAAADKAARFVELCDCYEFPIVTFVDNPGFMVGPQAEQEGIARHHARILAALHHRTVPLYAVQIRKAYGLGPYAMSGWGSARRVPEMRLAWPSVESGGMSLEGAAYLVKRKEIMAAESREEAMAIRDDYATKMRDATSGLRAGRSYQFDDIVHPAETRPRIIAMLERLPRALSPGKKHSIDPR
jgi:acetyl-CoA carboxylase carboxyltransferase component